MDIRLVYDWMQFIFDSHIVGCRHWPPVAFVLLFHWNIGLTETFTATTPPFNKVKMTNWDMSCHTLPLSISLPISLSSTVLHCGWHRHVTSLSDTPTKPSQVTYLSLARVKKTITDLVNNWTTWAREVTYFYSYRPVKKNVLKKQFWKV